MDDSRPPSHREMGRDYWDAVGDSYHDEIFSVRHHDEAGVIDGIIQRLGRPDATAADLGCGVGHFTPLLAQAFGQVQACDLSEKLLAQARRTCRTFPNVEFFQTNLGREPHPRAPVDLVLCVNVLIMAPLSARLAALRAVTAQVKADGHLLLVVPSLESMLYTQFRRIDWCLRDGMTCPEAIQDSLPRHGSVRDLHQGIRPIEGVPTKHYLREELLVLLRDHHFHVEELTKLTYPWTTEFAEPPDWMTSPLPWDWLALAQRKN